MVPGGGEPCPARPGGAGEKRGIGCHRKIRCRDGAGQVVQVGRFASRRRDRESEEPRLPIANSGVKEIGESRRPAHGARRALGVRAPTLRQQGEGGGEKSGPESHWRLKVLVMKTAICWRSVESLTP
jgi:hypothetical protein